MSGYSANFAARVGLIGRSSERAPDWDINGDVFNDSTTQEVNWHRHMTRVDAAIDYYNTNLKVEYLANKVDERNRSVVSAI